MLFLLFFFSFLFNIVFGACLVYTVLSVHVHAVRPAFAGHAGLAFIAHKAHEELLPEWLSLRPASNPQKIICGKHCGFVVGHNPPRLHSEAQLIKLTWDLPIWNFLIFPAPLSLPSLFLPGAGSTQEKRIGPSSTWDGALATLAMSCLSLRGSERIEERKNGVPERVDSVSFHAERAPCARASRKSNGVRQGSLVCRVKWSLIYYVLEMNG